MRHLVFAVTFLAAVAPARAAASDEQRMNEMIAGSSQRTVEASPGSGCFSGPTSGGCADIAAPPQYRGVLLVRRAHRIAFDLDHPVEHLRVGGHDLPQIPAVPVGDGRRWVSTLPPELPAGSVDLSVHADYAQEDGWTGERSFHLRLHVIRHGAARVTMPRLRGLVYGAAMRELERRGLRWRVGSGPVAFDSGPPPPPGVRLEPDPWTDRVRRQSISRGRTVRRGTIVRLETACSLAERRGAGCE